MLLDHPFIMNIIYHKISDRKWIQQTFPSQCDKRLIFGGRCQGVLDHQGNHWSYNEDGSYVWSKESCGGGGFIPPDHCDYINPTDMVNQQYRSHNVVVDVVDEELIHRLDRYDEHEWPDNVSVTRPIWS